MHTVENYCRAITKRLAVTIILMFWNLISKPNRREPCEKRYNDWRVNNISIMIIIDQFFLPLKASSLKKQNIITAFQTLIEFKLKTSKVSYNQREICERNQVNPIYLEFNFHTSSAPNFSSSYPLRSFKCNYHANKADKLQRKGGRARCNGEKFSHWNDSAGACPWLSRFDLALFIEVSRSVRSGFR